MVLPHVDSESDPPNFFPLVIFYLSAPFQGKKKLTEGNSIPLRAKKKGAGVQLDTARLPSEGKAAA